MPYEPRLQLTSNLLQGKKFAEEAAWEVHKKSGVEWELVALCPPMVYGPLAHKPKSMDELNESMARLWNLFLKDKNPDGEMPSDGVPVYIDVRVCVDGHIGDR